jgi:hypothetical protein
MKLLFSPLYSYKNFAFYNALGSKFISNKTRTLAFISDVSPKISRQYNIKYFTFLEYY